MSLARRRLRGLLYGFWLGPSLVVGVLIGLGFLMVAIDRAQGPNGVGFAFGGNASAARAVLTTVAASLITIAGLVFSITIVTLQLVSAQFTPRAMRRFLGDRTNQLSAGTFVGVFVYCLIVLRSVRDREPTAIGFRPALGVTVAMVLGVLGLALLLFFIHHVATSIQVSTIAAAIAQETLRQIDRLYPEPYAAQPLRSPSEQIVGSWWEKGQPGSVRSKRPGYVQSVDLSRLAAELHGPDARLVITVAPGDFVTQETDLAHAWPTQDPRDFRRSVHRAVQVADERDINQDAAFGIRQLTDIALRAISPGVNDPTTAVTCIYYIQSCFEQLAGRALPDAFHRFRHERVDVVARCPTFAEYVDEAFIEIGRYATHDARVAGAALDALAAVGRIACEVGAYDRLKHLQSTAETIAAPAIESARTSHDHTQLTQQLSELSEL